MVGIGLYIRLGILETPTFTRIIEERRVERAPVIEVLKRHPKLVALTALARTGTIGIEGSGSISCATKRWSRYGPSAVSRVLRNCFPAVAQPTLLAVTRRRALSALSR